MAVITVYQCDRDGAMFTTKKEADEYDKQLELAENFSALIEQHIPNIDQDLCEEIGLLLAKQKEIIAQACKGKPEILLSIGTPEEQPSNVKDISVAKANHN